MEEWRRSLRPRIEEARAELRRQRAFELALRAGAQCTREGLRLAYFGEERFISYPKLVVHDAAGNRRPEEEQLLILDYLRNADGTPPAANGRASVSVSCPRGGSTSRPSRATPATSWSASSGTM